MKTLKELVRDHQGRPFHKWEHYYDIYDRWFSRYRGEELTVLEVGVDKGGSLELWRKYFGESARIVGADIKEIEIAGFEIRVADQRDFASMRKLRDIGPIDILIDDGRHTMDAQITTFRALYPSVRGLYCVEDTHTSYMKGYGGGYRHNNTFIEEAKGVVDQLHAYHSRDGESFMVDDVTMRTEGIHFYDSLVVIEKSVGRRVKPKTMGG